MDDAEKADLEALAAAHRGDFAAAATFFERNARAKITAGEPKAAFAAFANAAQMRRQINDLRGALASIDEALALPSENEARALALMTRGSVLDALDHPDAPATWMQAQDACGATAQGLFCLAHSTGGLIKQGISPEVASGVLAASRGMPVSQVVGLIGAMGESAGKAGLALLAQAVLILRRHTQSFNASTAPYVDMLAERVGDATPLALGLSALALVLSQAQREHPDHGALQSRAHSMLTRCAQARKVTVESLLAQLQANLALVECEPALRELVPAGQWVISES